MFKLEFSLLGRTVRVECNQNAATNQKMSNSNQVPSLSEDSVSPVPSDLIPSLGDFDKETMPSEEDFLKAMEINEKAIQASEQRFANLAAG